MKKALLFLGMIICALHIKAQIPVTDGANLAQSIIDYALQITNGTSTIDNTLNTFQETRKVFDQGKKYYDGLQNVHGIIKDGRKVQESISLSVQMITGYSRTMGQLSGDKNFTSEQMRVYNTQQSNIMLGASDIIEDITKVITNTGMSMSDKERLDALESYHIKMVSLYNKSRRLNLQMIGESESINQRKSQKRLERELLR